jgi:serine protease Do
MRCLPSFSAVLGAAALFSLAPLAAAAPVRPRAPIAVKGEVTASVIFAQLLIKSEETGEVNGLKDEFVDLFNDELRNAGYPVPKISRSAFKEDSLPETDYVLAGTLTEFDCNDEQGTTCALAIEWELLHRATETVVYKMTARAEETEFGRLEGKKAAKTLLLGGLRSLLARRKFVEAFSGAAPSSSGAASPEFSAQALKRCSDSAAKMPKESEKALGGTVLIKTKQGIGSGAMISPDGFILTAAHVVDEDVVDVKLKSGGTAKARVLRVSKDKDVALLRLENWDKRAPCLPVSSGSPKTGEDVYVLGAPGGEELAFSLSRGIVSGMRTFKGTSFLQTDASINPGNSGGPIVNATGQVLAITSWKVAHEDMEGLGFGVPVSTALSALAIEFGDETGTIVPEAKSQASASDAFVDTPEVPWFYVGDEAVGKTPGWVQPVRTWGYATAGTGAVVLLFSFVMSDPSATRPYPENALGPFIVGCSLLGVGVGMVVSSYVFKPDPVPPPGSAVLDRTPAPRWTAELSPSRVQLGLQF